MVWAITATPSTQHTSSHPIFLNGDTRRLSTADGDRPDSVCPKNATTFVASLSYYALHTRIVAWTGASSGSTGTGIFRVVEGAVARVVAVACPSVLSGYGSCGALDCALAPGQAARSGCGGSGWHWAVCDESVRWPSGRSRPTGRGDRHTTQCHARPHRQRQRAPSPSYRYSGKPLWLAAGIW